MQGDLGVSWGRQRRTEGRRRRRQWRQRRRSEGGAWYGSGVAVALPLGGSSELLTQPPGCGHDLAPVGQMRGRCRWRPYRVECTGSLPTSEVKRRRARLVLGWGTAREDLRVPPAFATPTLLRPQPATTLARLQPAARTDAQQAPPESPEQQAQDQARPQPNATWSGRRARTRAHIAQHTRAQRARACAQTNAHTHTHTLVGPWARMTFLGDVHIYRFGSASGLRNQGFWVQVLPVARRSEGRETNVEKVRGRRGL